MSSSEVFKVFAANDESLAITINGCSTSYRDLRELVEKEKQKLKSPDRNRRVFGHFAIKELKFIVRFIALFELDLPQAIFSQDWSEEYCKKIYKILGPFTLIKNEENLEVNSGESLLRNNTSVVLFTSGTTGVPKGVELSFENIKSNIVNIARELDFEEVNEQSLFLPLSYSYGLIGQLLPGLYSNQHITIHPGLMEFKTYLETCDNIGMVAGVPAHLKTLCLVTEANQKIEKIVSAGAFLPKELRLQIQNHFHKTIIYNNYGQTELAPRGIVFNSKDPKFFSNITGRAIADLEVKVDSDANLMFKGSHVMLGYIGDGDLPDGWLNTKDKAIIEDGLITIQGRSDQLVKIDGERIHPLEIENSLESLTGVREAAVLVQDHQVHGNILCAIISKDKYQEISVSMIRDKLSDLLSQKKIPKIFKEIPELPKNSNGKKDRKAIHSVFKTLRPLK